MRNNSHLQKEKELASAVERWKTGEASNEELSLTAKTAKGELKITIKKRIKAFLLEEQEHRCAICKGFESLRNYRWVYSVAVTRKLVTFVSGVRLSVCP